MSVTTGAFPGVRIVDMPDLGAFNDSSSVVGERAGSGRFNALALRNYIGQPATINVRQFGAVGDGVADDTFAIQAAIDSLSAYGGGVAIPPGVYRITAAIKMRPNIVLQGNGGATIKQGNAANLTSMIECQSYAATNAVITGLAIDGNRANNTGSNLVYLISSFQPGTQIVSCTLSNAPGAGVLLEGGNPIVANNIFSSTFSSGVILRGPAGNTTISARVSNNKFTSIGYFGISGVWADYNIITGNSIFSQSLVHHVTTAGTAVTWVSGAQFTGLLPGMFMRIAGSGGGEFQIQSIQSATALTLTAAPGAQTNVAANSGQADLINIDCCAYNIISENSLEGGMSGGVVIHNSSGTAGSIGTIVTDNTVTAVGSSGISLQSDTGSSTVVDTSIIQGNTVIGCGVGGAANSANSSNGIWLVGSLTHNTLVSGNTCNGFAGGFQLWGIYVDVSVPAGQTSVMGNVAIGNTTGDVFGAGWQIYTPSLSAATGAFTSAVATGRYRFIDKTVQFQVTVRIVTNGSAANSVVVGLPLVSTGVAFALYSVSGRGTAISGKGLSGHIPPSANTVAVMNFDGSYPGASGEVIAISGTYEVA
jgi:hypothetical protein